MREPSLHDLPMIHTSITCETAVYTNYHALDLSRREEAGLKQVIANYALLCVLETLFCLLQVLDEAFSGPNIRFCTGHRGSAVRCWPCSIGWPNIPGAIEKILNHTHLADAVLHLEACAKSHLWHFPDGSSFRARAASIQRHVSASSTLEMKQASSLENPWSLGGLGKLFYSSHRRSIAGLNYREE